MHAITLWLLIDGMPAWIYPAIVADLGISYYMSRVFAARHITKDVDSLDEIRRSAKTDSQVIGMLGGAFWIPALLILAIYGLFFVNWTKAVEHKAQKMIDRKHAKEEHRLPRLRKVS